MNNKIREFIMGNLICDDEIEINDNDNIFELGFVNSLFAMKLLNYIEQEFDITVNNEDIDISNFSTVNKISQLIERSRK